MTYTAQIDSENLACCHRFTTYVYAKVNMFKL